MTKSSETSSKLGETEAIGAVKSTWDKQQSKQVWVFY